MAHDERSGADAGVPRRRERIRQLSILFRELRRRVSFCADKLPQRARAEKHVHHGNFSGNVFQVTGKPPAFHRKQHHRKPVVLRNNVAGGNELNLLHACTVQEHTAAALQRIKRMRKAGRSGTLHGELLAQLSAAQRKKGIIGRNEQHRLPFHRTAHSVSPCPCRTDGSRTGRTGTRGRGRQGKSSADYGRFQSRFPVPCQRHACLCA